MNLSNATVRGYKPFPSQRTPNGTITITAGTIDGGSDLEYEKTLPIEFEKDAQSIYDVLSNNLPGGTLHQLLIKMLQGKLNLFIVADKEDLICQDCGSRTIRALVAEQEQASASSPDFAVGDTVGIYRNGKEESHQIARFDIAGNAILEDGTWCPLSLIIRKANA